MSLNPFGHYSYSQLTFEVFILIFFMSWQHKTHLKPLTTWLHAGFCNSLESSSEENQEAKEQKIKLSIASSLSATTCCKCSGTFPHSLSSHLGSFHSFVCMLHDLSLTYTFHALSITLEKGREETFLSAPIWIYLHRVVQVHCRWGVAKMQRLVTHLVVGLFPPSLLPHIF